MNRTFWAFALSLVVLFLAGGCIPGPPGSQERVDLTVVVNVFADLDGDGHQDNDEPGIPGTLAASHYNEHGFHARRANLTGENGQTIFSGTYTHFFDVGVAAPCGYQATTETTQNAAASQGLSLKAGNRQRDFGFAPPNNDGMVAPKPAQITFELWQDLNGDGQQDAGEPTFGGQSFAATPYQSGINFMWPDPADMDDFSFTSGPDGTVKLDLGNSCGQIAVRFPRNADLEVTASQPIAATAVEAEDVLVFSFGTGMTHIVIGLKP